MKPINNINITSKQKNPEIIRILRKYLIKKYKQQTTMLLNFFILGFLFVRNSITFPKRDLLRTQLISAFHTTHLCRAISTNIQAPGLRKPNDAGTATS